MIQYFKNVEQQTVEIDNPEEGSWVNVLPPLKQEEFTELSETLDIPIDFLKDSLDIDERSRYEIDDKVKLVVIKTPAENNSFNESDAYYITIPICIILTHNQIVTVNSFENEAIKKFLNSFQNRNPDKKNMMALKILEKVTNNFQDYLKEINQRRNSLEQKLYQTHQNEELLHLMRIQKSFVHFITALKSNELLMMKIKRTNLLQLTEDELDILDDLIVETSQSLEMANTYSNILGSTLNSFSTIINNNQNEILKRLTNLTVLLSIPFLFSIIYGMNEFLPFKKDHSIFWIPFILTLVVILFIFWRYKKTRK